MLTEQIINAVVLIAFLYGVHWLIVHIGKKFPECDKKCINCFWLYWVSKSKVVCVDPNPLTRYVSRSIINKFYCAHHWFKKEELNKSIGKGEVNQKGL